MIAAKPIAFIRLNSEVSEDSRFRYDETLQKLKESLPDYNVLLILDVIDKIMELEVHNLEDGDLTKYEELEKRVLYTLNK